MGFIKFTLTALIASLYIVCLANCSNAEFAGKTEDSQHLNSSSPDDEPLPSQELPILENEQQPKVACTGANVFNGGVVASVENLTVAQYYQFLGETSATIHGCGNKVSDVYRAGEFLTTI